MRWVVTPQDRVRIHADLKIIATLFDDNTRVLWPIMCDVNASVLFSDRLLVLFISSEAPPARAVP